MFLALKKSYASSNQTLDLHNMTGRYDPGTVVASLPVDPSADCIGHNKDYHFAWIRYSWHSARCLYPRRSRNYFVKCNEVTVYPSTHPGDPPEYHHKDEPVQFPHLCPVGEVCMPMNYGKFVDHKSTDYNDIQCVDEREVESVKFEATQEKSHQGCSSALQVPGPDYASTYTTGTTNFILTAEVSWADGKPYKAPAMFIRDETPRHPYDRAYVLNTDVVSTKISVESYRGRLLSRTIRFCFEQLTWSNRWAVLSYTWFKAPIY